MHEITIEAEVRKNIGKQLSGQRRDGQIPGIFYVAGEDTIPLLVAEKALKPLIYTSDTHIINLKVNGSTKNCILREIQFDPVTERPIHFDFLGLRDDREITVEVPVVITGGTPVGVRDGGILQNFMYKMKISCLPKNIPEHVEVNAENLKVNQSIHVKDITLLNVKIVENENSAVVGVIPPTVEKEPVAGTATDAPAEPELVATKGKKLEEDGATPAAGGEKKADAGKGAAGDKGAAGAKPAAAAKPEKK